MFGQIWKLILRKINDIKKKKNGKIYLKKLIQIYININYMIKI